MKVSIDYHVEAPDRRYYSVPYIYVGEVLDLRITARTVEVFRRGRRVASHVRLYGRQRFSTDPAHTPSPTAPTPSGLRRVSFLGRGRPGRRPPSCRARSWRARPHPEQGLDPVSASSASAAATAPTAWRRPAPGRLVVRAFSYRSVESILKNGLDQKPLPAEPVTRTHPHHDNVRGPTTTPRGTTC